MGCAVETLKDKFEILLLVLNERGRRLWAGVKAHSLGRAGFRVWPRRPARHEPRCGVKEILSGVAIAAEGKVKSSGRRTRRLGGNRKRLTETSTELVEADGDSALLVV